MAAVARPRNVGIKAIELYVPNKADLGCYFKYISQSDLEKHDQVSTGKYEIGLGQVRMGFCDDREVSQLLNKYDIDPESIGRLEVGTETLLDKSKSVKSVLMQLFTPSGNTDVEGVDTVNACYGGTNALFNAVNWVESSAWDGRDAIVVAGDIAIYEKGPARPTGGAGAVAMLIGPDAPLVLEPFKRGTYMQHTYDFYKPNMSSEYPVVDGHYSIECFSRALDGCHKAYSARCKKLEAERLSKASSKMNGINGKIEKPNGVTRKATDGYTNGHANGHNGHTNGSTNGYSKEEDHEQTIHAEIRELNSSSVDSDEKTLLSDEFDYMCFHTPNTKLAQKSYGRLLYNDFLLNPQDARFSAIPGPIRSIPREKSYGDKSIEKAFLSLTSEAYKTRSSPSAFVAANCGNMYTASLYGALASLICEESQVNLQGKRIAMFSYGSGLASSLFSIQVLGDLSLMKSTLDVRKKLKTRLFKTPTDYEKALYLREVAYSKSNYIPHGDINELADGTYYLTEVDAKFRRTYAIKQ